MATNKPQATSHLSGASIVIKLIAGNKLKSLFVIELNKKIMVNSGSKAVSKVKVKKYQS